jgi:hypothetical protein
MLIIRYYFLEFFFLQQLITVKVVLIFKDFLYLRLLQILGFNINLRINRTT